MHVFLVLVAIATGAVSATGLVSINGPNPWTSNGVNAQQPKSRSNPSSFTANAGSDVHMMAANRGHPQPHEGCPRPQICVPQQELGGAPNKYVRGARSIELMKLKSAQRKCPVYADSACFECAVGARASVAACSVEILPKEKTAGKGQCEADEMSPPRPAHERFTE